MLEHHEKYDGTGYPHGLAGNEISLMGRIIAVADTFDAMTTHRPYQKAMDGDFVVDKIIAWKNERFDPDIVDAFVRAYEKDLKHNFKKPKLQVTESEHGKTTG
jgi:HD-GYP domain-containing protein (c-di-GMP phosphodiesterase class II)